MNKYNFELMIELRDDFEKRAKEVCKKMYEIENKKLKIDEFDHIYIGRDSIIVHFKEELGCQCCVDGGYEIYFPIDYLFNDNWIEDYREEVRLINEEKIRIREQKKLQKIKETEKFEIDMLKKLKEKYEQEGD